MNLKSLINISLVSLALSSFSGCSTTEGTLSGAAVGTALGAGMGYAFGGTGGAAVGGAVGGLGGGAFGHYVAKEKQGASSSVPATPKPVVTSSTVDDYELSLMRKEVEKQRLLNEKMRLEKEREMIRNSH